MTEQPGQTGAGTEQDWLLPEHYHDEVLRGVRRIGEANSDMSLETAVFAAVDLTLREVRRSYHIERQGREYRSNTGEDLDEMALRRSEQDLSDIDSSGLARAREGFRHAHDTAQGISDGTIDPMSAR